MTDHDVEWLTAQAAGELLGLSARQVQRYGADPSEHIRTRQERRRVLYHADDIRALGARRLASQQRVTNATSHSMSRPNEWKARYDDANQQLIKAAHTIGELEERIRSMETRHVERVRELEEQLAQRPLLEDHTALKAERDQLQAALERLRRPWWKRLLSS